MTRSIVDIGVHNGDDTAFYLAKGFRVIGVEANPRLAGVVRERFAKEIASGQFVFLEGAISDQLGEVDFFMNLDKDDWSSVLADFGTRQGTRHDRIRVPAVDPRTVFEAASECHYLKCDIEGGDIYVLRSLHATSFRPKYVSFELHDTLYLAHLAVLGYDRFKLVNQNLNWLVKLPQPPLEGNWVEHQFLEYSSGPFGEETPGTWMNLDDTVDMHLSLQKIARLQPSCTTAWFDVHAKRTTEP